MNVWADLASRLSLGRGPDNLALDACPLRIKLTGKDCSVLTARRAHGSQAPTEALFQQVLSLSVRALLNLSHFPGPSRLRLQICCDLVVPSGAAPVVKGGSLLKYLPGSGLAGGWRACEDALSWV